MAADALAHSYPGGCATVPVPQLIPSHIPPNPRVFWQIIWLFYFCFVMRNSRHYDWRVNGYTLIIEELKSKIFVQ